MSNNEDIALWIIAFCLVIQTIVNLKSSALVKKSVGRLESFRGKNPEHDTIKKVMDSGQYGEALKMALDRQRTKPGDGYFWYYAGICYYNLKDWDNARQQLREAQRIFPTWEKEWTGPYLHAIEQQTGEGKKETT
jgi:tetratricopeptide (TPR) repeat protein